MSSAAQSLYRVDAISQTPRQMHVLALTPFYPTDANTASGCFIAEPIRALPEEEVLTTVLALHPIHHGDVREAHAAPSARWVRYLAVPGGIGLSSAGAFIFAQLLSRVRKLHVEKQIDLIHAHAALPCGHAAMLLGRELGVPFVVSVHGLDAFSTNQVTGWPGDWCRRVSRRVYGAARNVICISDEVRKQVAQGAGPDCRTSVVYNGVDATRFSPFPMQEGTTRTVLSVGNLTPIKGHELLLRAFASIHDRCRDVVCDIIGEGPERTRLEGLANELGVTDQVRFLGRRNRDQVADAMRACSLFVLPSRYEGLGCVYLEAMSSAKAVIACRGQGIQEIIRHGSNGWLVGTSGQSELAGAMLRLLDDPDLCARMGKAAHSTILQGLTLEHQAEQLTQLYREASA